MQQANTLGRYNGRLAELGVTPAQIDRFLQLKEGRVVVTNSVNGTSYGFTSYPISDGLSFPAAESELQTLLGPATYQRVKDYDEALPIREAVSATAGMALLAGTPLSAGQTNELMQAVSANSADPQVVNILSPEQLAVFQAVQSRRALHSDLQAALDRAMQKAVESPASQE